MKRAIILGLAVSVFVLMLVSCASEPLATSTTTRQTTGSTPETTSTTPVHAPGGVGRPGQGTVSSGYWSVEASAFTPEHGRVLWARTTRLSLWSAAVLRRRFLSASSTISPRMPPRFAPLPRPDSRQAHHLLRATKSDAWHVSHAWKKH